MTTMKEYYDSLPGTEYKLSAETVKRLRKLGWNTIDKRDWGNNVLTDEQLLKLQDRK